MQEISFEEWFDIFYDKCRSMGYRGPIDKYSFDINYDLGETPEQAASEFVNEVNG